MEFFWDAASETLAAEPALFSNLLGGLNSKFQAEL